MQIEVEKKFLLTPAVRQAVTIGATRVKRQTMTDIYYDSVDWRLATHDTFLRQRDGAWELKVGDPDLGPHGDRKVNRYQEIEDQSDIARQLDLASPDLATSVPAAGHQPFVTITTDRTTYEKDGFTIVIDQVSYPEGDGYAIVEIELVGETLADAEHRILEYAERLGLPSEPVLGKLQEYCERHRPDHITAMKAAGQLA